MLLELALHGAEDDLGGGGGGGNEDAMVMTGICEKK